jgi:hypothetical protein
VRVHVLTPAGDPISYHFVYPLRVVRPDLRRRGCEVVLHSVVAPPLFDCDVLMVVSRFFASPVVVDRATVVRQLGEWSPRVGGVVWCDVWDSTGSVAVEVLPYVGVYAKKQLARDRDAYLQPLYGDRLFTDQFHRLHGIEDPEPWHSRPVAREELPKLRLSWNLGMGQLVRRQQVLWRLLVRGRRVGYARQWLAPGRGRKIDVMARMQWEYPRPSIAFQRQRVRRALDGLAGRYDVRYSGRVGAREYLRELARSRVVVSPFGWGEICYRDFEAWTAGAALLKPAMDRIETWPSLYRAGETYEICAWDVADLTERLQGLLEDPDRRLQVAIEGQRRYREALSRGGLNAFCDHFLELVSPPSGG